MSPRDLGDVYEVAEFDDSRLLPYLREIFRHAMLAQLAIDLLDAEFADSPASPSQDRLFMGIQVFLASSAMISKLMWPVRSNPKDRKNPTDEEVKLARWKEVRKKKLRKALEVDDSSPLKNRDLRNVLEHYDEHLDKFVSKPFNAALFEWTIIPGPEFIEHLGGNHPDHPLVTAIAPESLYVKIMATSLHLREINDEVQRVGKITKCILNG